MRKKFALVISFFCSAFLSFSQVSNLRIDKYTVSPADTITQKIMLEMSFGKFDVTNISGDISQLRRAGEIILDVVFTDYPSRLSLQKLNNKRVQQFYFLFPFISKDQVKQINFYRQLNGTEKTAAEPMFHGIIARFRPVQDKGTIVHDLAKLEGFLIEIQDKSEGKVAANNIPTINEKTTTNRLTQLLKDTTEKLVKMDTSKPLKYQMTEVKKIKGLAKAEKDSSYAGYDSISTAWETRTKRRSVYSNYYRLFSSRFTTLYKRTPIPTSPLSSFPEQVYDTLLDAKNIDPKNIHLPDSTIFKVLLRNKWEDVAVVGDVTGSMYPYTAQLLLWLKLYSLDSLSRAFAFFNDGDNTPDNKKKIGKTGGIYVKSCHSFEEARDLVIKAMKNGGGGDAPENNIEALLEAESSFSNIKQLILIADNWARIKDKALAKKIRHPVRIILCGVLDYNINVDYLNLARKTGGSVHLMEEDLLNLALLHEGEILQVGRRRFILKEGEFIEIASL